MSDSSHVAPWLTRQTWISKESLRNTNSTTMCDDRHNCWNEGSAWIQRCCEGADALGDCGYCSFNRGWGHNSVLQELRQKSSSELLSSAYFHGVPIDVLFICLLTLFHWELSHRSFYDCSHYGWSNNVRMLNFYWFYHVPLLLSLNEFIIHLLHDSQYVFGLFSMVASFPLFGSSRGLWPLPGLWYSIDCKWEKSFT